MLVKVKPKTLIHYQSSSSMAKRLKQNTFNTLSFSQQGFESRKEQIEFVKVKTKALIHHQPSSPMA